MKTLATLHKILSKIDGFVSVYKTGGAYYVEFAGEDYPIRLGTNAKDALSDAKDWSIASHMSNVFRGIRY